MFYVKDKPTSCAEDWRKALQDPRKHWRAGFSAWALAHCWEAAHGFPPEIHKLLSCFPDVTIEKGLVEHLVGLPGRGGASHNDLFVLAHAKDEYLCIAVEGKLHEKFGPTLQKWRNGSPNRELRLAGLLEHLGLSDDIPNTLRYQLLHRLASPVIEAKRRHARRAIMIVHSFSDCDASFSDFVAMLGLYGMADTQPDTLYHLRTIETVELYAGWARGDRSFATDCTAGED